MPPSTSLLLYSVMAHQSTRGTWTAPETRPVFLDDPAAPYCTPAQLVVALLTRWMLVFEDPMSDTLWLGKSMPRDWLEDGKTLSVESVPTRWGRVGFAMESHLKENKIVATVNLPSDHFAAAVKIRLRTPGNIPLKSVRVNGKPPTGFNAQDETITVSRPESQLINVVAEY